MHALRPQMMTVHSRGIQPIAMSEARHPAVVRSGKPAGFAEMGSFRPNSRNFCIGRKPRLTLFQGRFRFTPLQRTGEEPRTLIVAHNPVVSGDAEIHKQDGQLKPGQQHSEFVIDS